ncbi:MAG: hypothetical protein NC089_08315 [Bacteroides sp.]|nr:hypothetical protein [Bacteroides sp.]MCM1549468.1 hypothetical protein [Clostridium sp.]
MKKRKLLLCVLAAFCIFFHMPTVSYAEESDKDVENNEFTVSVETGLDGIAVEGKAMPVTVTISNAGKDFSGILRVIIPASYDQKSLAYEKSVAIPSGGTKSISMLLPDIDTSAFLRIELENEKGKILYSQQEKYSSIVVGQNVVVGILSSDYSGLNYFDGASVNTSSGIVSTKIIQLTADNIPDTGEGLDSCHYILIDNYNTAQLSEEQRNAIAAWVGNGGMLIMGTGSKASVVLEGFRDSLCPVTTNGLEKREIQMVNGISGDILSVDTAVLSADGWQDVQGDITIGSSAWKCGYGNGTVLILSYDLAMEPIASWNERELLASVILENAGNDTIYNSMVYGQDDLYDDWRMKDAVNSVDRNKIPNALLYAAVFLVYVICIGPVAYLVLKAKDKREKMWFVMPAVALVFTVVIYGTSMIYQIHKPFIDAVSIVEFNNGSVITKSYMTMQSPKGKAYMIDFADGYRNMESWSDDVEYSDVGQTNYPYAVRQDGAGVQLRVNPSMAFTKQNLVSQKEEFRAGTGIVTELECTLAGFEGTVTNNTGYDLKNVVICYNENYAFLGAMKNGETVTIQKNQLEPLSNISWSYYISNSNITKAWMEQAPDTNILFSGSEENRQLRDNANVYAVMKYRVDQLSMNQGMVFGMLENYDEELVKGKNTTVYSTAVAVSYFNQVVEEYQNYSLFINDINEYMVGGDRIAYSSDYPEGFDYFYDLDDLDMYGETEKEVLYDFGLLNLKGAQLLNMNWAPDSDAWDEYYGVNYCEVQLYNYTTQTYENPFDEIGIVDDLTPYVNEQGWMQVRYYTDDPDAWDYYAPQISLIGGEQ